VSMKQEGFVKPAFSPFCNCRRTGDLSMLPGACGVHDDTLLQDFLLSRSAL